MRLPSLLAALGPLFVAGSALAKPKSEDWIGLNPFDKLGERSFFEHPPIAVNQGKLERFRYSGLLWSVAKQVPH